MFPMRRVRYWRPDLANEKIFPPEKRMTVIFRPEVKWRLIEECGPDCYEVRPDGHCFSGKNTRMMRA